MRIQHLERYLNDSLSFPTDIRSVCDTIGSVEIDAPSSSQTWAIQAILHDHENEQFDSAHEIYQTILANLPEGYVGRKYYSDRGEYIDTDVDGWSDELNQSF